LNLFTLQPHDTAPPPPGAGETSVPSQAPTPTAPQGGPAGGSSSMLLMLMAFVPVILFMFFSNRSQQKRQKDMESKLKKGDRVVTQSGLVGKLVDPIEGRHARIEIAPGVKVQVLRTSIAGLDAEETPKSKDEPALADKK
jgi:preprotein translocase subunit YajC